VAIVAGNFDSSSATNNFPDLAVVNRTDNTVSILLGNGDGTFAAKNNFAVGTTPSAIASADFNNDGGLDLAVTNSAANSVSVLLGGGDGTFSKLANDVATGNGPAAIATGNFNGVSAANNNVSLAVANQTDNTISILLGNGDGTFGAAGAITAGTGPDAILSADFNNDGVPDLVVTNGGSDTVSAFLGLGSGTFAPPLSLPTGNTPVALAQGDANGDGSADLAVVNQSSDSVSVILNTNNLASLLLPNAALSPYPASEYVDLGLKVHAVPRIHPNGEVTLDLEFDISSLAGQNVNGIPILTNRTINQTVRLRENETSVLSGIMESSNLRSSSGWPGIGQIPVLNDILSNRGKQVSDTELLIAITPRQLRSAPRVDRTFYAGRGAGPGAPAANQPPPPGQPPPGNQPPANVPPNANAPAVAPAPPGVTPAAPGQVPPPGAAAPPGQAPPAGPAGPQN
jgi:Bacterial type II and III secretion system protein/FG-GAP-like repeat